VEYERKDRDICLGVILYFQNTEIKYNHFSTIVEVLMRSARALTSAAHHGLRFLLPARTILLAQVRLSLLLHPVFSLRHHTAPPHGTRKKILY
jgi:hypothetical protein